MRLTSLALFPSKEVHGIETVEKHPVGEKGYRANREMGAQLILVMRGPWIPDVEMSRP